MNTGNDISYGKVGCGDGCGTRVVSIESLKREIKQLHAELASVVAERDELRKEAELLKDLLEWEEIANEAATNYALAEEKENEQLRARLDAAQWQPIDTAPKDGRLALVFRPLAHMSRDENIAIKRLIGGNNRCWDSTVPAGETPCNPTDGACHVTHWMPLPIKPPAARGE